MKSLKKTLEDMKAMFDSTMKSIENSFEGFEDFDDITGEFDLADLDGEVVEKKTEETETRPDGTVIKRSTTTRRVMAKKP